MNSTAMYNYHYDSNVHASEIEDDILHLFVLSEVSKENVYNTQDVESWKIHELIDERGDG